ncbi:MFS transporter [Cyanobium sp. Morenito 9A2]|uniref:MFS transporter n=1 Tax=Cyanobium sp. Morenito 9A2 TaxID=2823718 RepID=UPI0020CBF5DC|nr:MFS transporter [Cyanobium sp. Morenito 9A2]MCP9849008.1 hypothetical protein [Cyanobium sp. Morenito 9A2]
MPWFLQDLATYGLSIHLPRVLGEILPAGSSAAVGTVLEESLLVAGGVGATMLCRWVEVIPQQIAGFCGCAFALALAAWGARGDQPQPLLLAIGLGLFLFTTNLGPNATTYLLAGNVFPAGERARGAGLATAAGKGGAVLTALLVPLVLERWGPAPLLVGLGGSSLLGAALTWGLARQWKQRLDDATPTVAYATQHANEK